MSIESSINPTVDQDVALPRFPVHHNPESARQDIAAWNALHQAEKRETQHAQSVVYGVGRVFLAIAFLAAAANKMLHFGATVDALSDRGFTDASALVLIALMTELVGGLLLAVGYKVRFAAYGLIGYLMGVTFLLNGDFAQAINRSLVFANLGFAAGLLLLSAHGAGPLSLERYFAHRFAARARAA